MGSGKTGRKHPHRGNLAPKVLTGLSEAADEVRGRWKATPEDVISDILHNMAAMSDVWPIQEEGLVSGPKKAASYNLIRTPRNSDNFDKWMKLKEMLELANANDLRSDRES